MIERAAMSQKAVPTASLPEIHLQHDTVVQRHVPLRLSCKKHASDQMYGNFHFPNQTPRAGSLCPICLDSGTGRKDGEQLEEPCQRAIRKLSNDNIGWKKFRQTNFAAIFRLTTAYKSGSLTLTSSKAKIVTSRTSWRRWSISYGPSVNGKTMT